MNLTFMDLWSMIAQILLNQITLIDPKNIPQIVMQDLCLITTMCNSQDTTSIFYCIICVQLLHQLINACVFAIQNHIVQHATTYDHIWKKIHMQIELKINSQKIFFNIPRLFSTTTLAWENSLLNNVSNIECKTLVCLLHHYPWQQGVALVSNDIRLDVFM